jgi:hypothetical protein
MTSGREQESILPEIATLELAHAREIRELRAMNDILVRKVMELEDLVDGLRKTGKKDLENDQVSSAPSEWSQAKQHQQNGHDTMERETTSLAESDDAEVLPQDENAIVVDLEPARHVSSLPISNHASALPATVGNATRFPTTPLPNYSLHLPPIDRTKKGEDFYADLQAKRIIPGYDEDRFSCWCHVCYDSSFND